MGGRVASLAFILAAILIAGVGIWLFLEDEKTVQSTTDRLESLDRKISAQETQLNRKLADMMNQITAALEADLAKRTPVAPPQEPKIIQPIEVKIINPVKFIPAQKRPILPKSVMPKEKKTKPSER